jgi:hypothetical protein
LIDRSHRGASREDRRRHVFLLVRGDRVFSKAAEVALGLASLRICQVRLHAVNGERRQDADDRDDDHELDERKASLVFQSSNHG